VTVAANCCVFPTITGAVAGEIETLTEAGGGDVLPPPPQDTRMPKVSAARITIITKRIAVNVLESRSFVSFDTVVYLAGEIVAADLRRDRAVKVGENWKASE